MAYQQRQQDDGMGFWGGVGAALGGSAALGAAGTLAGMTPMGRAGIRKAADWAGRGEAGGMRAGMQEPLNNLAQGYDDIAGGVSAKYNEYSKAAADRYGNLGVVRRNRELNANPIQDVADSAYKSLAQVMDPVKAKRTVEDLSALIMEARGANNPNAAKLLEKAKQHPEYGQIASAMDEAASERLSQMTGLAGRRADHNLGMAKGVGAAAAGGGAGYGAYELMDGEE